MFKFMTKKLQMKSPEKAIAQKQSKFKLKNGMTVLLHPSTKSPVVSAQVWVRTGSADEQKSEEGISHFIEHLVFKGTRKFNVGEIASIIEGSGGELNAYTSFDQTVFYVTISKHFVETGVEALAEMMGFPKFDPTEVDNEREVVVEEIKRGLDSPGRRASQLLFSTAFKKHAYGIPVIGYEKTVRSWPAKVIEKYYHARYAPKNMFVVIAGDFETAEMKAMVTKYFGEFVDYKIKKITRKKEPKQASARIGIEEANFEQSLSYLAWKVPPVNHKDIPALDILAMIFGQGDSSRLVKKLRIESATVNSIGSSIFSAMNEGLFAVSMGYSKERFSDALEKIKGELLRILSEPVTVDEIKRAVVNLESDNSYLMETVDGISRKIGDAEFLMHDPNYNEKYLKQIRQVTPADIQRVAKKYLTTKTLNLISLTNDKKSGVEKIWKQWLKDLTADLKKIKTTKAKPAKVKLPKAPVMKISKSIARTEKITLSNGVSVLLHPNTESRVVCVKAASLGGLRAEPEALQGLTELMSRTWTGGTKSKTEMQINQEIEEIAAGLSPVGGRNSIGLGLDVLSSFQEKGRELFIDNLLNPQFPTEVVEREKMVQLEQIKNRKDNAAQLAIRQFMEALYGNLPYSRDMLGSEESLRKIGAKEIQAVWKKALVRKNLTLILAGPYDDKWVKVLETATSALPEGEKFEKRWTPQFPAAPKTVFQASEKEQSHLIYAFPGLTLEDKDRFALEIMQSILAGQGGRLFLELRDKNSLAYSVSPLSMEGIEPGYFGAYIGCSPDKVTKALEMMKIEFKKLTDTKVPEKEILRAQRYVVGRHDIDLQRTSAQASSLLYDDIYGLDFRETFKVSEKIFAVTAEDVQRVARRIFSGVPVTSLVGPKNPLE
jgi:zinc protease